MIKNYPPLNFVEANNRIECAHLMDAPKISDDVIEADLYTKMFTGCPSVTFETVIERPEPQAISEPEKFDGFDWNKDFSEAYKE